VRVQCDALLQLRQLVSVKVRVRIRVRVRARVRVRVRARARVRVRVRVRGRGRAAPPVRRPSLRPAPSPPAPSRADRSWRAAASTRDPGRYRGDIGEIEGR